MLDENLYAFLCESEE